MPENRLRTTSQSWHHVLVLANQPCTMFRSRHCAPVAANRPHTDRASCPYPAASVGREGPTPAVSPSSQAPQTKGASHISGGICVTDPTRGTEPVA